MPDDATDVDVRRLCYEAFLAAVEPKAHEILEKHRTLQLIKDGKKQTNAERKAYFHKTFKKLKEMVRTSL